MVLPLIPVVAAVGASGVAAGALAAVGLSKKEASIVDSHNQQNVYHQPYENYQPQIGYAPVTTYSYQGAQYMINSPNSTQTPKQATSVTSDPSQSGSWTTDQPYSASSATGNSAGIDWTLLAIIAAVGLVGYGFVSRK